MAGGAVSLARMFLERDSKPDLIVVDDMFDLTTFLALTRKKSSGIPTVLYMHENQLTYPLHKDKTKGGMRNMQGKRDRHLVFVNYASMMAADHVYFNSRYHLGSWFRALPNFLKNYPDFNELDSIEALRAKSSVLHVGVEGVGEISAEISQPPLILWNQRWEYDKNPQQFLQVIRTLHERDNQFRVAFCGENFSRDTSEFDAVIDLLAEKVVHVGFASAEKYAQLLQQTSLTFSTAIHEFFGISIVEAMLAGAFILLPRRLSYPELIPAQLHAAVLYDDHHDLIHRLEAALQHPNQTQNCTNLLQNHAQKFTWAQIAPKYDDEFRLKM